MFKNAEKKPVTIQATETLDAEGDFTLEKEITSFTLDDINNAFSKLLGKNQQTPPLYSAISKGGRRLYDYARNNEKVEIPSREIEIMELELIHFDTNNITYRIVCSKGTYIRVVNQDLAVLLNNIGYTTFLKRTKVGDFSVNDAYSLENIESNIYIDRGVARSFDYHLKLFEVGSLEGLENYGNSWFRII